MYSILKVIGKGGQGTIYLAYHEKLNEVVCIKQIDKTIQNERRGIELMREVKHPNFPKTLDFYEDETYYYHVMEYIQGETLSKYHHQLNVSKTIEIGLQLIEMIDSLRRQQLTYNDLKPDNILISSNQIYIVDYGAVLREGDLYSTRYGSVAFSSPEYIERKVVSWKSDLYSIGKILNYICNHPSKHLRNWIKKATALNQNLRFESTFEAYEKLKKKNTKLLFVLLYCFYLIHPFILQRVISAFTFDTKDNAILFHCLNDYSNISEEKKFQLSNQLMSKKEPIYWMIQASLCEEANHIYLQDRAIFMRYKTLDGLNLQKENLYFYIYYLLAIEDNEALEKAYYYLNSLEVKSIDIIECQVQIAFRLQREDLLCENYDTYPNTVKALCLYRLFQLGHYNQGFLHEALNLLEGSNKQDLIDLITYEIMQWGERS